MKHGETRSRECSIRLIFVKETTAKTFVDRPEIPRRFLAMSFDQVTTSLGRRSETPKAPGKKTTRPLNRAE
jgi:hypothetical protein